MTLSLGFGLINVMIPLVVLAVPPILVTTYEAMRSVDPAPVDAARGMGMHDVEVLFRVELPVALPLILGGLRSAAIQIVSTATIAAYVSLGGLGRYIVDGLYQRNYEKVVGGAALVALMALATLALFWGSPGSRSRAACSGATRRRAGGVAVPPGPVKPPCAPTPVPVRPAARRGPNRAPSRRRRSPGRGR